MTTENNMGFGTIIVLIVTAAYVVGTRQHWEGMGTGFVLLGIGTALNVTIRAGFQLIAEAILNQKKP